MSNFALLPLFCSILLCITLGSSLPECEFNPKVFLTEVHLEKKVSAKCSFDFYNENLTISHVNMSLESEDESIAVLTSDTNFIIELSEDKSTSFSFDFKIKALDKPGDTKIKITLTLAPDGTGVVFDYNVIVYRQEDKSNVDSVLRYISLVFCYVSLVLAGCSVSMKEVQSTWDKLGWIAVSVLVILIIIPLLSLGMAEIFGLLVAQNMGAVFSMTAPPGLLVIPVCVLLNGDIPLSFALLMITTLLSNAALPLLALHYDNVDSAFNLRPAIMPYVMMIVIMILAISLFMSGLILRYTAPPVGRFALKGFKWVCSTSVMMSFIASAICLRDMNYLLDWKIVLYSIIVMMMIVIIFGIINACFKFEKTHLTALFVCCLVDGSIYASVIILKGLTHPERDFGYAACAMLSFSSNLMIIVMCVSSLIYQRCISKDEHRKKLVTEIGKEDEEEVIEYEGDEESRDTDRNRTNTWAAYAGGLSFVPTTNIYT